MRYINPASLTVPRGYNHGVLVPQGALLFVAGQIGSDRDRRLVSDRFTEQFDRALWNLLAVVEEAGGSARSIVRLTIFVTDKSEYLSELEGVGEAYRLRMGRHFPAMTLVEVKALLEPGAKVEIEGTAVVGE
jgi:enamine deaminase RidA (YjgF/YER057c/UK114 family)